MKTNFCQSCAMPMQSTDEYGTNQDNSPNNDYCIYCFKDGQFTQDVTMDEMIEHNLKYLGEFNKDSEIQYTPEQARAEMKKLFPQLKRWQ